MFSIEKTLNFEIQRFTDGLSIVEDVLFIEVRNHNLDVVTENQTYTIRSTLGELENSLEGRHFSRPSNSFLVNLRHVESFRTIWGWCSDGAGGRSPR